MKLKIYFCKNNLKKYKNKKRAVGIREEREMGSGKWPKTIGRGLPERPKARPLGSSIPAFAAEAIHEELVKVTFFRKSNLTWLSRWIIPRVSSMM